MPESATVNRLAVRLVDTRVLLGRDFGSQARVLAVCGLVRLVWAKPAHTVLRNPGMVRAEQAATLELRVFKRVSDGSLAFHYASELWVGGRLSRARLAQCRGVIDDYFGHGATAQIDLKTTVVFGVDLVGDYLAPDARTPVRRTRPDRLPRALPGLTALAATHKGRSLRSTF